MGLFDRDKSISIEIERVIAQLSKMEPDSPEYSKAVLNLKLLFEARSYKSAWTLDANTILGVAANLLGIGLILNYERLNVISRNAIGFVMKGRLPS